MFCRLSFSKYSMALLFRRRLVVVREVAKEQESQHIVAEIIRVHRPAQLVGDAPEGLAQLFLVVTTHWTRLLFRFQALSGWS